jgi:hypothetical protein
MTTKSSSTLSLRPQRKLIPPPTKQVMSLVEEMYYRDQLMFKKIDYDIPASLSSVDKPKIKPHKLHPLEYDAYYAHRTDYEEFNEKTWYSQYLTDLYKIISKAEPDQDIKKTENTKKQESEDDWQMA